MKLILFLRAHNKLEAQQKSQMSFLFPNSKGIRGTGWVLTCARQSYHASVAVCHDKEGKEGHWRTSCGTVSFSVHTIRGAQGEQPHHLEADQQSAVVSTRSMPDPLKDPQKQGVCCSKRLSGEQDVFQLKTWVNTVSVREHSVICLTLETFWGHSILSRKTASTPEGILPFTLIFTDRDADWRRDANELFN